VNKIRGTFKSVAVKAPGFGDRRKAMLADIAILTVVRSSARPSVSSSRTRRSTCSVALASSPHQGRDDHRRGAGDADQIAGRVAQIRSEIEKSDSDYDARSCRSVWRSSPAVLR